MIYIRGNLVKYPHNVTVRLSDKDYQRLEKLCAEHVVTKTEFLRGMLVRVLNQLALIN